MDLIKTSDIDFSKLELDNSLMFQKNAFYIDHENNLLYKFFSDLSKENRDMIIEKLEILSSLKKDYLSKIVNVIYDECVVGYTQEYIKGDTLSKLVYEKSVLSEIKSIIELSKNLEDLHKNGVVVCDLHFSNVMVNEEKKPIFIDQESYKVNNLDSFGTATILNRYFSLKCTKMEKNPNLDRISLFLNLFDKMLGRSMYCVSNDTYIGHYSSDPMLHELSPIFFELSNRSGRVPIVPYLHQVLRNYDNS